jgi:hypothetical protein
MILPKLQASHNEHTDKAVKPEIGEKLLLSFIDGP